MGLVLIFGSSTVSVPWVSVALGILAMLKGLFFILGPKKKTKALIDWWLNAPSNIHKTWGLAAFLIGVLLLVIIIW